MPIIELKTHIQAPIERCFDLSRSIDAHIESTKQTNEKAIDGKISGLIELDEYVTWEARHFGIAQRLTSKITIYEQPHHFRDSMVSGPFRRFDHDHYFLSEGEGTIVTDIFDFDAPFGPIGHLANRIFLTNYMRRLLISRNNVIKQLAESDKWSQYLK